MLDKKIIRELAQIVGRENILSSKITLTTYSYDSSPFFGMPGAVVFPTSTEEVVEVVKLANKYGISLTPRGAGTCLSGGAITSDEGIIISLTRFNKILEINPVDKVAVVEPGVTNLQVQLAARPYGLMFAPDPGSQNVATIGGNIAENAGGMRGVKYGCTKEHVLGLEVVLPSGEVIRTGSVNSQLTAEVDLTHLFCGSEGILGIITKAWLVLSLLSETVQTMTTTFASIEDAGACVAEIIANGVIPTAMEIMDNTVIKAVDDYLNLGFPRDAQALLLLEIDGFAKDVEVQVATIINAFKNNNALSYKVAQNEEERQELWIARRSVNGALGRLKPANIVHDIVVPRDKLATMLKKSAEIAQKYGVINGQVAHAGDGNIHPTLYFDHRNPQEVEGVEKACDEIIKETIALGGSISGEHGIGLEKLKYVPLAFSQPSLEYMKKIKNSFDPENKFNPGKLLP